MKTRWLGAMGLVCALAGCASSGVKTQPIEASPALRPSNTVESAREFHIPAAAAPTALNVFSRQADTQVLFDYVVVRDRTTRAVDGLFTPTDALAALLKGSGLVADAVNARTIAITADRSGHALP